MAHKRGWSQGEFNLKHHKKYIGSKTPIYRSSYEERAFNYCDWNENVVRWASELIEIPYYFEFDQKNHKYVTDIYMEVKTNNGKIVKYVVEIKPKSQNVFDENYKTPKPPKKKTTRALANYRHKIVEQERNKAKWLSAIKFCKARGYIFKIMTEEDLF